MGDIDYSKIRYNFFSNYYCTVAIDAIIRNDNSEMMRRIINKGFDFNKNKFLIQKNQKKIDNIK